MTFLDKAVADLSLSELRRLIANEVGRQIPAIPAGVAELEDHQFPLITPLSASQGMVLGYDRSKDTWVPMVLSDASDGDVPDTPLTVTVQPGIDFFAVGWTPVLNNDAVEYDVHVSTSNGFTPSGATLVGTVSGTLLAVRQDPATDAAFVQGTTYYFVVIARDPDGSSAASTQVSSVLVQVNSDDIAANSITAGKIVAGSITAEKLEAFLVLGTTIATASAGARVVFDSTGIYLYDSNGNISMSMDAQSGTLQIRGRIDFGRDPDNPSRLSGEDYIEFYEQPTTFTTPNLEQSRTQSTSAATDTRVFTYRSGTTKGNFLHLKAVVWRASGTPPAINTPTGWTLLNTTLHAGNRLRMATFKREDSAKVTSVTVTLASAISVDDWFSVTGSEWSGVENASTAEDKKTTATGTASATVDTGTTAATTQADELVLSSFAWTYSSNRSTDPAGTLFGDLTYSTYTGSGPIVVHPHAAEVSAYSVVSATGAQDNTFTLGSTESSIGHVVTLKSRASSGGPGASDVDRVRLYAKDVSALSKLHVTDEAGTESAVVLGTKDQVWRFEIADVAVNAPNLSASTGQNITVSIASLVAGDYCFFIGHDIANASQYFKTDPICTTPGQITLRQFNTDPGGAVDLASGTFSFVVIHRS